MPQSISISGPSIMNGYHSEKEKRIHQKKASKITWKTYDYVQSKDSSSCCYKSNINLKTPLTDRATFEMNIKAIEEVIEKKIINNDEFSIGEILNNKALKVTTIPERISEAKTECEFDFLEDFLKCYNPKIVLEKYNNLDSKCQKLFIKIIGGNEALKIIEDSKKICENFEKKQNETLEINRRKKSIENIRISIKEDQKEIFKKKITYNEREIRNTFRYFQSEKMFGEKGFIFLNNRSLQLPTLSSTEDEGVEFLKWFREQITSKITNNKDLVDYILPFLSFNIFLLAYASLRSNFSNFFTTDLSLPRLKLNSSKPTRFFINKIDEKTYEAFQEKNYSLKQYFDNSVEDCEIGQINIGLYFKLSSEKKILSSEIYIKDIDFFDNIDRKNQLDILESLKISEKEEI